MAPRRRPSASPSHHKGRFEPSEPLHMTTRNRAARGSNSTAVASTNGSTDGSMNGDDTLHPSNDHTRPSTSHSLDARPLKMQRLSNGSRKPESLVLGVMDETAIDDTELQHDDYTEPVLGKRTRTTETNDFAVASPPQGLQDDSRMEESTIETSIEPHVEPDSLGTPKMTTPSPPSPNTQDADELQDDSRFPTEERTGESNGTPQAEQRKEKSGPLDVAGESIITLVAPAELTPRRGSSASDSSPQQLDIVVGATYDDATPMQSAAASPDTSISEEESTKPTKVVSTLGKRARDPAEAEVGGDEMDADEEGKPSQKKIKGGRKRAMHPDPKVEAAMRRQLELKVAYRNITRSLKPVLAELANRTLDDLQMDEEYHAKVREHEAVKERLGQVLEERVALINRQAAAQKANLLCVRDSQSEVASISAKTVIDNMKDATLDSLQHKALEIMRAANIEDGDGDETEDEDGVVPLPKGMSYKFHRRTAPGPEYQSRSRAALETRQAYKEMDHRLQMAQLLKDADEYQPMDKKAENFTTMDCTYRDFANEMRTSRRATNTFAEAAGEYERVSNIPIIPNEQVPGLMALGDLASRPSIQQAGADAQYLHDLKKAQVQQGRRPSMASSQAPTGFARNYDITPMDFSRAAGQHPPGPNFSMPPPNTPRQGSIDFLVQSPQMERRPPPSPALPSPGMGNFLGPMSGNPDASSQASRPRASSLNSQAQATQQSRQMPLPVPSTIEQNRGDDSGNHMTEGLNFRGPAPAQKLSSSGASPEGDFSSRLAEEASRAQRELMQEERGGGGMMRDLRGLPNLQHQGSNSQEKNLQEQASTSATTDMQSKIRQGHKPLGLNDEEPRPEAKESRSRASSMAQSTLGTNQSDSGREGGDTTNKTGKAANEKHHLKTSKETRDGLSRRQHRLKHGLGQKHHRKSTGSSSGPPKNNEPRAAEEHERSQVQKDHGPFPPHQQEPHYPAYSQPPSHHPDYRHMPPGYGHPGFADQMGHPPGPYGGYHYSPYGFDPNMHSHHRNSYPPPLPSGGPNYGYPSPLYAMPHPMGGPPPHDAYPPPHFYGPPPSTPSSHPPASGPMTSSYGPGHQYGGPAIAPAAPSGYFTSMGPYGAQGPLPPHAGPGPAFAQQARNSMSHNRDGSNGGTEGRNRSGRSASDAGGGGGFKQWFGPEGNAGRR